MSAIPEIERAYMNMGTAKSSTELARYKWEMGNWSDCEMWINDAISQLEAARAKVQRHAAKGGGAK